MYSSIVTVWSISSWNTSAISSKQRWLEAGMKEMEGNPDGFSAIWRRGFFVIQGKIVWIKIESLVASLGEESNVVERGEKGVVWRNPRLIHGNWWCLEERNLEKMIGKERAWGLREQYRSFWCWETERWWCIWTFFEGVLGMEGTAFKGHFHLKDTFPPRSWKRVRCRLEWLDLVYKLVGPTLSCG